MKKIYFILFACIAFLNTKATTYTVALAGFAYSPSVTTCAIGDVVIIQASAIHPNVEVSFNTWSTNGTVAIGGGWGMKTSTFSYTAVSTGTNYFVCSNHVASFGMKGMIVVNATSIAEQAKNFLNEYNVFPNPATDKVNISLGLNETKNISIKMYNVLGQTVATLVKDNSMNSGNHEYSFELPQGTLPGNYFIEVSSGDRRSMKKLIVTK